MCGKRLRWNRFLNSDSGLGLIVPIDHGLTAGPIAGIRTLGEIERWIGHPGITGVIVHKGLAERLANNGIWLRGGLMIHLNGMTALAPEPDRKELLTSVEAAIRHGADAVSVQVNFDGTNDAHNLKTLGAVVDAAGEYSLPVLTMLYDKVREDSPRASVQRQRHLMRAAVELGADALKIAAPADPDDIGEIIDGFTGHTAVLFAGGPLCSESDTSSLISAVVAHGATGLCAGRNVFQHDDPWGVLTRMSAHLHASRGRRRSSSPWWTEEPVMAAVAAQSSGAEHEPARTEIRRIVVSHA